MFLPNSFLGYHFFHFCFFSSAELVTGGKVLSDRNNPFASPFPLFIKIEKSLDQEINSERFFYSFWCFGSIPLPSDGALLPRNSVQSHWWFE